MGTVGKFFLVFYSFICFKQLFAQDVNVELEFSHLFDKNLYTKEIIYDQYWDRDYPHIFIRHHPQSVEILSFNSKREIKKEIIPHSYLLGLLVKQTSVSILKVYYKIGVVFFESANNFYFYHLKDKKIRTLTQDMPYSPKKLHGEISPDGKYLSYIRLGNIFLVDLETLKEFQITQDAGDGKEILNGHLSWVYQEEIFGRNNYKGYWWSPNGEFMAYLKTDQSEVECFPLIEYADQYPKVLSQKFPKVGCENPKASIQLVDLTQGLWQFKDFTVDFESIPKNEEFLIVGVDFSPGSNRLIIQTQDRYQKKLLFHLIDLLTLRDQNRMAVQSNKIYQENSKTWVNRLQEKFYWLNDDQLLFLSEYNTGNYTHIKKLTITPCGETKINQITQGAFDISSIEYFNSTRNSSLLYFVTNKESLLRDQLFVLKGGKYYELVSPAQYSHKIIFSPSGKFYYDNYENIHTSPISTIQYINENESDLIEQIYEHVLYTSDMTKWKQLKFNNFSFLEIPNRKNRTMQAMYIEPKIIKENTPVLLFLYGGPGTSMVKDAFNKNHFLFHQYLANLGYFVFILDPVSSNSYGKSEKSKVYQKLGQRETSDILDGVNYLVNHFNYLDEKQIGVWGWSYGGFMSSYLLSTQPELFSYGISVAPVTDWTLYDSIYTERYMGPLNKKHYKLNNIVELSSNMKAPLLLVHGGLDDNVHPQHAMNLMHARCLQENQYQGNRIEFACYPQGNHGLSYSYMKNFYSRMLQFILTNKKI